ncbi:hypothetical protein pah_c029o069 [Parachlamydia acanthamoebae str. Hall's coccus]|nr:hypothetical protein pah_c029o069 [Parachlamydia acanthamoebae str. Hall's coccus]
MNLANTTTVYLICVGLNPVTLGTAGFNPTFNYAMGYMTIFEIQ